MFYLPDWSTLRSSPLCLFTNSLPKCGMPLNWSKASMLVCQSTTLNPCRAKSPPLFTGDLWALSIEPTQRRDRRNECRTPRFPSTTPHSHRMACGEEKAGYVATDMQTMTKWVSNKMFLQVCSDKSIAEFCSFKQLSASSFPGLSHSAVVNSSQEDLETTVVEERVVQWDSRPQIHHNSHRAYIGPHWCCLWIWFLHS